MFTVQSSDDDRAILEDSVAKMDSVEAGDVSTETDGAKRYD